jgi:hypothetical protein
VSGCRPVATASTSRTIVSRGDPILTRWGASERLPRAENQCAVRLQLMSGLVCIALSLLRPNSDAKPRWTHHQKLSVNEQIETRAPGAPTNTTLRRIAVCQVANVPAMNGPRYVGGHEARIIRDAEAIEIGIAIGPRGRIGEVCAIRMMSHGSPSGDRSSQRRMSPNR